VYFLPSNPKLGWICGFGGITLRTTDGGKNWIGQVLRPDADIQLESIWFVNEKVGYTSGGTIIDTSITPKRAYIFKSTNGGVSWFDITPGNGGNVFWGNYFVDENNGVLMGNVEATCDVQLFWHTSDGGANWEVFTLNVTGAKLSDAVIYDVNGLGYAVGSGAFFQTNDGGRSWFLVSNTGDPDWHEDLNIFGNTILLPVSSTCTGDYSSQVGGVAISNDKGKTWRRVEVGAATFGTFLHDEIRGWVVGFNRVIKYTNDAGKTWSDDNCGIPDNVNLDDLYFINDTTGWVVGEGIYEYFVPKAEPPVITSNGTKMCEGDTLSLTALGKFDRFIWSTGDTSRTIVVNSPGEYYVRAFIDSICYSYLSNKINVDFYPKKEIVFKFEGDSTPCISDTITLSVNDEFIAYKWSTGGITSKIKITESGNYYVSVVDSNGCITANSFTVNFNPLPKPTIRNLSRSSFCEGDKTQLLASDGYMKYEWYDSITGKFISSEKLIDILSTGNYFVKVLDSNGCEGISSIESIKVKKDTNALFFYFNTSEGIIIDTTMYPDLKCGVITIKNLKPIPQTISDIYLFKNIAFSSPLSQFPITIQGLDSINIMVCFSPVKLGKDYDTVLVPDICTDHLIPVESYGIAGSGSADSKCEVPLSFDVIEFSTKSNALIGKPYPNPVVNNIKSEFELNIPLNQDIEIKSGLTSVLGNKIVSGSFEINKVSLKNKSKNVIGIINIDTQNIPNGFYILEIEVYGNKIAYPVMVNK
jgi:photosystem II stability/assembly factor-like uncharacterized protein